MIHKTLPRFWKRYYELPATIRALANKQYDLLKLDPFHPSLHFKKVGSKRQFWSVRVSQDCRALGVDIDEGVLWFWIGTHAEYDSILAKR